MTGSMETRVYLTGDAVEEHLSGELEQSPDEAELFLAKEHLHPSLDEIFRQIDAAHKRADELRRLHPAHGRGWR